MCPCGQVTIVHCMTTEQKMGGIVPEIGLRHRIAIARDAAGLRQIDLSRAIGISRATLAAVEQGVRVPRRGEVIAIAFACGVPLEWLETGETPADPDGSSEGGESPSREPDQEPDQEPHQEPHHGRCCPYRVA